MSKLKNIFGLPESLVQAAFEIHETSHNKLKGDQDKIDVAEPKGEITAADFDKLRAKKYKISPSKYDIGKMAELAAKKWGGNSETWLADLKNNKAAQDNMAKALTEN